MSRLARVRTSSVITPVSFPTPQRNVDGWMGTLSRAKQEEPASQVKESKLVSGKTFIRK